MAQWQLMKRMGLLTEQLAVAIDRRLAGCSVVLKMESAGEYLLSFARRAAWEEGEARGEQ
jgi:hypothetical protein